MQTYNANMFLGAQFGQLKTSELTNWVEGCYKDTDVIIYNIHLPEYVHLINYLSSFLEAFEKEKALKFYKEKDKNRFIICRSLLKHALAYHTQSQINEISIERLPNKKPYVPKYPNLFFNLSHSGDYAVLAISNAPIGIDIEYMDLNYAFQETLSYIFNKEEIYFIDNSDNRIRAFYSLWTRKEAFAKALGKGIDDNFSKIPCLDGQHRLDTSLFKTKHNWEVQDFDIANNYIGAMAYKIKARDSHQILVSTLPNNIEGLKGIKAYQKFY